MRAGSRPGPLYRAAEIAAWTVGAALLLYYAGTRIRQASEAKREVRQFQERQKRQPEAPADAVKFSWQAPDLTLWSPERIKAWQQVSVEAPGSAIAVLRIPRIGLEVPVFEGTSDANLDRGAGHIEGTPAPGAAGNVGIAGHRDGFFRVLKDVVLGDSLELETRTGTQRFVVDNLTLVGPDDTWVLDDTPSRQVSLVTCYPFYYQGSAPRRYIVQAAESAAGK
ncbi:MAG TPA: class D sortase [Thermoanaerobaculia bacterium]|nr:class D sortase [Thermoanaerobaculia bacterium]